ncbi:unnamed protein product [Linum trigynum]|uniref:GDSL esterase/lipase n=2 Tax=Linum trigynum TaxID=586398 RepID=A0AAV2CDY8_9ROSI
MKMGSAMLMNAVSSGVVLAIALACLSSGASSAPGVDTAPAMFVFGDSLVDVGNNNYLPFSLIKADFEHNGLDFASDDQPTGRFCNGKNSADWLAERFGLAMSPPPYLALDANDASSFMAGVSFASGGAHINGSAQDPDQAIGLADQISYYESVSQVLETKMGSTDAKKLLSESVYTFVIGSNDIFFYYKNLEKQTATPSQFVHQMALTLNDQLKRLYEDGARRFVVAGVPSLGCTPKLRVLSSNSDCSEAHNAMASMYNQQLKSVLSDLKAVGLNATYEYLDTFAVLQRFVQNPASYGFVEVNAACCGLGDLRAKLPCLPFAMYCDNRNDHVFWDFVHPTEAAAEIIVDSFFKQRSRHI